MKGNDTIVACNNCRYRQCTNFLSDVTSWEHRGTFRFVRCDHCGLVFLHPRPKKDRIGKYYPAETYWGHDRDTKGEDRHWKEKRDKAYNFLYQAILATKKRGAILDIGAGNGVFLTKLKEQGWEVTGVELSKSACFYARKMYNIALKNGDFLDFTFAPKKFNVITLNNALEHLYHPAETLVGIYTTLKTDGVLIITVPNISSVGFRLFGKNWHALQPPRHLYHFSPQTLSDMLKRRSFVVTKIDHGYFRHNYYSLFESFRYFFSPRFKKKKSGGLVVHTKKSGFSVTLLLGKIVGRIFAFTIAYLGTLLGQGEVITAYAKKRT